MHHFNYRVIQSEYDGESYFEVCEVWYNKNKEICFIGTESTDPIGNSIEELKAVYCKVMTAFEKPILIKKEIVFAKPDFEIESSESEEENNE